MTGLQKTGNRFERATTRTSGDELVKCCKADEGEWRQVSRVGQVTAELMREVGTCVWMGGAVSRCGKEGKSESG